MIQVKLYWNHICVLHKQELIYLNQIREHLLKEDIDLQITCFGLGYGSHMSDYLRREDSQLPDIIVSADLEVFEDRRIFERFRSSLHPITKWFPVKDTEDVPKLLRDQHLLPYVAIPLVFYGDKNRCASAQPLALLEAVQKDLTFAFGGIKNSAAKTVVKTIMERYGEDAAASLLTSSQITDMPIQAFHQVRMNKADLALVPSIYALRADEQTTSVFCPSDGAVAIPSYICVRNTIDEYTAKAVISRLTAPEICNFYVQNGNLISCAEGTQENTWLRGHNVSLQLPSWEFIRELDPVLFYKLYNQYCFVKS
ncbi:MAG: ABC transporter substrate-binding protein [Lachnospiraceae bacterium]